MKIRCVANTGNSLPERYINLRRGYKKETEFPLTVGKDYTVYAFTAKSDLLCYYICADDYMYYPIPGSAPLQVRASCSLVIEIQVDQQNNINRRYRTLPVFDANQLLVGMLSYTNIFRAIQARQGCERFRNKTVAEVYKEAEKLTTLSADRTMLEAAMLLDECIFTHIPIMKAEGSRIVTGIVDDLTIATYQHPLLLDCFEELPLDEIKTRITDDNIVKPTDSVGDVIEKFLTITYPERPTAILACTKDNNGEFVLQGIVSYTDILKKFLLWRDGNNQPENQG